MKIEKSDIIAYLKDKHLKMMIIPLFFSGFLLIFGTYAWFTYFSDVNSTMTGHVIGWNIDFSGESSIEDEYHIVVDKIYPGMEDFYSELVITNSGEASALIEYHIKEIRLFETTYKVGEVIDGQTLTSEGLKKLLEDNFPFIFNFEITNSIVNSGDTSKFGASLIWNFETIKKLDDSSAYDALEDYYILNNETYEKINVTLEEFASLKNQLYIINDAEDTRWGELAYEYVKNNPDTNCVSLIIEVNASQYIE